MNSSMADCIRLLCVKADEQEREHGFRPGQLRRHVHLSPARLLELIAETGTAAIDSSSFWFNGCYIVVDDEAYEPWVELTLVVLLP